MMESDDIEFLDEDADLVQQCVQVQTGQYMPELVPIKEERLTPLLVERQPALKKKKRRRVDEDDSDYDPTEDLAPQSPPITNQKAKKKKHYVMSKRVKIYPKETVTNVKVPRKSLQMSEQEVMLERKTMDIRIPDYDDPLCLPVKAIKQHSTDVKRLNNWNNVCLEHFKHCDNLLKPERGETNGSTRTLVFKNVVNKQSGKTETTIWSKTCVENVDGDRKSEIFQGVLPRYKEKKTLTNFSLANRKSRPYHVSDEVILTKEDHKDGEVLVAYKPKESVSAVYKLVKANNKESNEDSEEKEDEEPRTYMKELLVCKMCIPCYQTSWRATKKNKKKALSCPICKRSPFVTTYNFLTHVKTHSAEEVRKYKSVISNILAEVVEYHYKCRTCRERSSSIKQLRQHLKTHQGTEMFTCEVGNHVAR